MHKIEAKKIIVSEYIDVRSKPKNLDVADLSLFSREFSKNIHATSIEVVRNADILRDTLFDKSSFKYLTDYTHLTKFSIRNKLKRLRLFWGSYDKVDRGIWIIDNWSLAYFHWLTDALTRLIASEEYLDNHLILLPNTYNKNPYKGSLEMLNFKVKYFDISKRLHVKELLLPSHTAPTGNYNKEIINKLRDRFLEKHKITPWKKIYISRQKAKIRKVTNEDEVVKLVNSFGFEIHYFEDYNFSEQVNLMQCTTHLIGLHGAGLTNMLFMQKNSKVLELRNKEDSHNNCFFSLASDLGHNYYYLLNDGNIKDTHFVNITVNIGNLEKAIVEMLT